MTDKDLFLIVEKARQFDLRAIAVLFEEFYPKIYRFFYYRIAVEQEAEDFANEVFLRLVKSIRNQKGSFEPWLYKIASNLLIDHYRRKEARKETAFINKIEAITPFPGNKRENNLLNQDKLKRVLKQLTPEQQQMITLKFIEGYNNAKVAQILNKSIGAVKALQFRAISTLKEILQKEAM